MGVLTVRQGRVDGECASALPAGFDDVVALHVRAVAALHDSDGDAARTAEFNCLDRFLGVFQAPELHWAVPVLHVLCQGCYVIAGRQRSAAAVTDAMVRGPRVVGRSCPPCVCSLRRRDGLLMRGVLLTVSEA